MEIKSLSFTDKYIPLTTDQIIILDVKFGDAQSGSFSVMSGSDFVDANSPATLGKASDIQSKTTTISATIAVTLRETKKVSVTLTITEGNHTSNLGPYTGEVEHELDTANFIIKLNHQ